LHALARAHSAAIDCTVFQPNPKRPKMNMNRRSRTEDALFVIALLVPAIFAGARYVESDRQMTQIAQAQTREASVALESHRSAPVLLAKSGR
jgi:hypothetical protein